MNCRSNKGVRGNLEVGKVFKTTRGYDLKSLFNNTYFNFEFNLKYI